VTAQEVFRPQLAAEALFQASDAQAAAHRLHARPFPHSITNGVNIRLIVDVLFDAIVPVAHTFKGSLQFCSVVQTGRRVCTAIDAMPAFRKPLP